MRVRLVPLALVLTMVVEMLVFILVQVWRCRGRWRRWSAVLC